MDPKISVTPKEFFITVFFLLLSLVERREAAASPLCIQDPKTDRCGNISIQYPFWLSGRQQPNCGLPPFELTCRNDSHNPVPVLKLFDFYFFIKQIFYHNQSFQLTTSKSADDECPIPYNNITSDTFPFTLSSSNKRVFFLQNCSSSENLSGWYQNITCPSFRWTTYFGGVYKGHGQLNSDTRSCRLVVVPVLEYSKGNYSERLKAGWLFNWTAPDCAECLKSGGRCGYDESTASFMCNCKDRNHQSTCRGVSGPACLCIVLLSLFLLRHKVSREKNTKTMKALLCSHGSLAPQNYKYSEIKRMTNSFSNKLGQGGYGTVYKGTLQDGHQVAVKVLREAKENGEEFINEVVSISRTSHVNVVRLLGFCMERSKRALVYEFMPNGSLEKFISSRGGGGGALLGWEKIFKIAVGIARGLEYLHRGCNARIVHFDIKPHNVLLDQDFCPKISDFGLAKLCSPKEGSSSSISMVAPRGTIGYIAPELLYGNFGTVSSKSDVYSYGMMILEMVGVTKMNDVEIVGSGSELYFPQWIYDHLSSTANLGFIAGLGTEEEEKVRKIIIVGLWCIQMMPMNRPTMNMVIDLLEGRAEDLQMPPKP
ncbi:hypothetical protein Cni_G12701 [Canna indica]|uniref:non-specific serine/threonine protein kinase n=1 Tax=Canna indica TaxID=4628 RepID=A0AAQ3KAC7_9LILI|nr:hypothetical protein Cni_G12701 [Canna indica]